MNESRYAFSAGLFVLAMIGLALFIVVSSTNTTTFFTPNNHYTVVFEAGNDVKGLNNRSVVRLFGVEVGKVDRVQVLPAGDRSATVRVAFHLPGRYELRQETQIQVQTALTGGSILNISDMGQGQPLAPDQPIVAHTFSLDQMLVEIKEAIPQVKKTLENFKKASNRATVLIDHVNDKIDPIVERYNRFVETGTDVLVQVRDVLGDTKVDIRTAIANITQTIATIKERIPGLVDKTELTLDGATKVVADFRHRLAENRHKIDNMMTSLKRAADNLEGAIADIRRAPWRLLNKPDRTDEQNLAVYAAVRDFAYAAQDVESAATALRAAAEQADFDAVRLQQMQTDLSERIERFNQIQDKIWKQYQFNRSD